jgi:hypothetical protein
VLPLYLDQLIRFIGEGGSDPPGRLADLIALRIQRLLPGARRVLQVLSVLGDNVDPKSIDAMLPVDEGERDETPVAVSIAALVAAQIIERTPEGLRHRIRSCARLPAQASLRPCGASCTCVPRRTPKRTTCPSRFARSTQAASSAGISNVMPLPRSGRLSVMRAMRSLTSSGCTRG